MYPNAAQISVYEVNRVNIEGWVVHGTGMESDKARMMSDLPGTRWISLKKKRVAIGFRHQPCHGKTQMLIERDYGHHQGAIKRHFQL